MTRLGRASTLLGVFAGDYAILMLINGQLTDFRRLCGCLCSCLTRGRSFRVCLRRNSCAAHTDQSVKYQGH